MLKIKSGKKQRTSSDKERRLLAEFFTKKALLLPVKQTDTDCGETSHSAVQPGSRALRAARPAVRKEERNQECPGN